MFATRPEGREFLKNTSRRKNGDMLFSKLDHKVPFLIKSYEPFKREGQKDQTALVLALPDGREFLWPLGSTAEYRFGELGFESPDEVIGSVVEIEVYETGSGDQYDPAKRIVGVVQEPDLKGWIVDDE